MIPPHLMRDRYQLEISKITPHFPEIPQITPTYIPRILFGAGIFITASPILNQM